MATTDETTRYICLFHDASRARAAVAALGKLNLDAGSITTLGDDRNDSGTISSQSLSDLGVPDRDLKHLQEGLRSGGVLVSLAAPSSINDDVERVFHHYSADKIDEADLAFDAAPVVSDTRTSLQDTAGEMVIPITEESLVVGKREVDRGGVRVLRRTVEEPIQESVDLHSERVVIEHRDVNRAATDADLRAGAQEIELVETAEVPVVQKIARVVEEVHVGKVESDRTEVVGGSVRHTEVDVEQLDTDTTRNGTLRD